MKIFTQTKNTKRKGFTLIELLVSMSVTMVIIGVLMAMTQVAVTGLTNSQNATRYSRLSQEVLTTMGKDLEGIVIRTGNQYEWVKVRESSAAGDELGPNGKKMKNPIEISFFSAVTDRYNGNIGTNEDNGGDISFVRYRLVYQDVIGGSGGDYPVFSLYRQRVNPDETFNTHLAQTDLGTFSDDVDGDDFLAENIFDITINFNFEFTMPDGSFKYKRIPIQVGGTYTSLSIKGNVVEVNGATLVVDNIENARLAGANLSMLILSDKGMKGIKNANISSDEDLAKYLKKHSKHYSKSVVLPRP